MKAVLETVNLSGNEATRYTLKKMRELINQGKKSVKIRKLFSEMLSGIDGRNAAGVLSAVFHFVKNRIRYQKDIHEVETLQTPERTLELGFGDCDDQSILTASIIEAAGYPSRIVLVSNQPSGIFHHVFIQGFDGVNWISMDTTENYYGTGYAAPLTGYYIEGGAKDMQILTLSGLNGFFPVVMGLNMAKEKKLADLAGMGLYKPLLDGMDNPSEWEYVEGLGFFKKLVKAVKKGVKIVASPVSSVLKTVASPVMTVAQMVTSPIASVAKAIATPLEKIPGLGSVVKLASDVATLANPVSQLKNLVNNITNPEKLLAQAVNVAKIVGPFLPPGIGQAVSFAADFAANPSLDPGKIAKMALNSVKIPGIPISVTDGLKVAQKLSSAVKDPKTLLTLDNALSVANAMGIKAPQAVNELSKAASIVKTAKEAFEKTKDIAVLQKAQAELEPIAKNVLKASSQTVLQVAAENEEELQPVMDALLESKLNAEKLNRISMIQKGNTVPDAVFFARFEKASEADAVSEIVQSPEYQKLDKIERINRIFTAIVKRPPTVEDLKKYTVLTTPEGVLFTDLYTSDEFKNLQAKSNVDLANAARREAEALLEEKRKKEVWEKTRFININHVLKVELSPVPVAGIDMISAIKSKVEAV